MKLVKRLKGVNKIDDELAKLERQMEELQKKKEALILKRAGEKGTPATWTSPIPPSSISSLSPSSPSNSDSGVLVEVTATESEYWDVAEKLQTSMRDAHISKLWRVQNSSLWASHEHYKDNFIRKNGICANEALVFHGTGDSDPGIVYNNQREGFSMNSVSKNCVWGRGIYFSEQSAYCDKHDAYRLSKIYPRHFVGSLFSKPGGDRPYPAPADTDAAGDGDEREMFLATLLVGSSVDMNQHESESMKYRCNSLTSPPQDPTTKSKYDTVTGRCDGSKVYVVYENGRAHPEYLIRYYRGSRNAARTPFANRKDAISSSRNHTPTTTPTTSISNLSDDGSSNDMILRQYQWQLPPPLPPPATTRWEFLDNTGWSAYSESHQQEIELFYQTYRTNPTRLRSTLIIQTDVWQYEVDVAGMIQQNVEHHIHRKRNIRRVLLEEDPFLSSIH